MHYDMIIGGKTVLSGNIGTAILIVAAFLICLIILIDYIWRKLKENSRLKYEFITIIAHKFRTPLTYVKWVADAMINDETDSYKKQNLESIRDSNQKLIGLTGTLIEVTDSDSKSRTGYVLERLSLCELVRNISDNLKNSFHEKNIFLSTQCPSEDIYVKVDKSRMEFALQTIMENARIYTTPGRNVEVYVSREGSRAIVSVVDHGIGIAEKDISNVFSKFFRAKNAKRTDTEGFGVGLYLTKAIIRRHRGKINVYSEGVDKGSTFTISLPIVK